MLIRTTS